MDMLAETFVEEVSRDGGDPVKIRNVTTDQTEAVLHTFRDRALEYISAVVQDQPADLQDFDAKAANVKFAMTDGAFVGNFAQIELFLKGLDGYIGLPSHKVYHQMEVEHCFALDSLDTFVTSNYGGTHTHPRMEWEFVVCPVDGKDYPGIIRQPDPLQQFLGHPTAIQAGLTREEVSGPCLAALLLGLLCQRQPMPRVLTH